MQCEKESAVRHGTENELEAPCLKINFQRVVSSVLTDCLSPGDNPKQQLRDEQIKLDGLNDMVDRYNNALEDVGRK